MNCKPFVCIVAKKISNNADMVGDSWIEEKGKNCGEF